MFFGLSGKASAGKDTVADFLISDFNFDRKISFAGNLKTACMYLFDLTNDQVNTQKGKSSPLKHKIVVTEETIKDILWWMSRTHNIDISSRKYNRYIGKSLHTPREVLQFVGTDVMRYYVPTYHTDIVQKHVNSNDNIVITDVRFPNEATFVKDNGGFLIRIERPMSLRVQGVFVGAHHISEIMLDKWDDWSYYLHNTSVDLYVLRAQVAVMMKDLGLA